MTFLNDISLTGLIDIDWWSEICVAEFSSSIQVLDILLIRHLHQLSVLVFLQTVLTANHGLRVTLSVPLDKLLSQAILLLLE